MKWLMAVVLAAIAVVLVVTMDSLILPAVLGVLALVMIGWAVAGRDRESQRDPVDEARERWARERAGASPVSQGDAPRDSVDAHGAYRAAGRRVPGVATELGQDQAAELVRLIRGGREGEAVKFLQASLGIEARGTARHMVGDLTGRLGNIDGHVTLTAVSENPNDVSFSVSSGSPTESGPSKQRWVIPSAEGEKIRELARQGRNREAVDLVQRHTGVDDRLIAERIVAGFAEHEDSPAGGGASLTAGVATATQTWDLTPEQGEELEQLIVSGRAAVAADRVQEHFGIRDRAAAEELVAHLADEING